MTLQLNPSIDLEVHKLLMRHNNRPMKALYETLKDKANQSIELPMGIIIDRRCGIERRVEDADVPRYLAVSHVGATPLMLAIIARRIDVAKALLAVGADPNAKASGGCNSLMGAARNAHLEAIESLISYGAAINAVDGKGKTALHYAAAWGHTAHTSRIDFLDQSGADLEAVDDKGQTPLHIAAATGDAGDIKALLVLGANQAAVDNEGRTPLHCAAAASFVSVDAIEAFRCNVSAFEDNLTAVDKNGHTPFQVYVSFPRSCSDDGKARAVLTPK